MIDVRRFALIPALTLALSSPPCVAVPPAAQMPEAPVRVSGSPADRTLIERLEAGFRQAHPQARFVNALYGAESTLAGTYTGTADIAFLPRELREPMERMAYQWAMLEPPLAIDIAAGGLTRGRPADQIGIFVNAGNPIAQLSLAQLDAIFGAEHKIAPANARQWRDLDAQSPLAGDAIHVIGPDVESIAALFFRRRVMNDSRKWNPAYRDSADALGAVAADPAGIAFAAVSASRPGVRLVALTDGGAAVLPAPADVSAKRYPLTRVISVIASHAKNAPVPAGARAFIAYMLSTAGQALIADDGAYLPLAPAEAQRQQARLETAK